ncbi:MAG TPA: oxygenase MpaB family protein [Acidobacteriaceae bacterium]|jgi:uncharacterized protein (DUF2236 family)|nr:oxygenase MpaB family protein [Acidobacteriaceae bacterium]
MEQLVSRPELESLLEAIARRTPDPRAGIFGPGSISWKINREAALFLGAGRAALLQLAHPWVAGALAEHSNLLGDPIARFHNTFRIVFTMIFGSLDQALAAARSLHTLHTHIRGELREPVARWPRGAHYEANEIDALRWVFATLIESAVLAYECVLPLSSEERDGYYNESKTMAALFGIPSSSLPENWSTFRGYTRGMVVSDTLGVDPTARSTAHALLSGAGSWVHAPRWYRALTIEWMPDRLRQAFALEHSTVDRRASVRARRWLPRVWKILPASVRFVGPWHEAQARLHERPPGPIAHFSNRFWIGRSLLPFGNDE